jgi:hypothetical protein
MSVSFVCALLIEQFLRGPLAHIPLQSISTCQRNVCVVYWVEAEKCEEIDKIP